MHKSAIETEASPAAIGPYSQAIKAGNVVYTSGQIALAPRTGEIVSDNFEDQARQVLNNLKAVVEAAGFSMDDVVKTTCFLTDMGNFPAFNAIYAAYFNAPFPARSCVEVTRLPKDVLVEVEALVA